MRALPVLAALLASCADRQPADPIVVAIAGFETRADVKTGALTQVAEDHLHDRLVAAGRYKVVERKYMDRILQEQRAEGAQAGKLAGADWVVYGTLQPAVRGMFGADQARTIGEVLVHLRIVRVSDGAFIFSKTERGTAEGRSTSEKDRLLAEATRSAIDKLAAGLPYH